MAKANMKIIRINTIEKTDLIQALTVNKSKSNWGVIPKYDIKLLQEKTTEIVPAIH